VAGIALLGTAALTLAGPWIAHYAPAIAPWLPFDCAAGGHLH